MARRVQLRHPLGGDSVGGYYLGFLGMEFGKHLLVALHDSKVEQHVL